MKRTNLVLDEQLLEDTLKASGARTYSAAVEMAMQAFVRRARARTILSLQGSGLWQGDLSAVREDRTAYRVTRKRRS